TAGRDIGIVAVECMAEFFLRPVARCRCSQPTEREAADCAAGGVTMQNIERNFVCPESGERCTDPNCTVESCRETARLRAIENAQREKIYDRGVYEDVRQIVSKLRANT